MPSCDSCAAGSDDYRDAFFFNSGTDCFGKPLVGENSQGGLQGGNLEGSDLEKLAADDQDVDVLAALEKLRYEFADEVNLGHQAMLNRDRPNGYEHLVQVDPFKGLDPPAAGQGLEFAFHEAAGADDAD